MKSNHLTRSTQMARGNAEDAYNALYREWTHRGLPMRANRYGFEVAMAIREAL